MSNQIDAPPEFFKLAQAFGQGSQRDVNNEGEWIAQALCHLDQHGKTILKGFLTNLLSKNPNENELQKLWNSAGSNYYIVGNDGQKAMRWFLAMIRDQIE